MGIRKNFMNFHLVAPCSHGVDAGTAPRIAMTDEPSSRNRPQATQSSNYPLRWSKLSFITHPLVCLLMELDVRAIATQIFLSLQRSSSRNVVAYLLTCPTRESEHPCPVRFFWACQSFWQTSSRVPVQGRWTVREDDIGRCNHFLRHLLGRLCARFVSAFGVLQGVLSIEGDADPLG